MKRFDVHTFRLDKQLTQTELAEILQCRQSFISSIEKNKRQLPEEKIDLLKNKFGDISDYISNYDESDNETNLTDESHEPSAYISNNISSGFGYISVPSRLLDELTKLTETIHSQQRTIEILVNRKTAN